MLDITKQNIIEIKGGRPGKTVAIFCATHGNEKAGVEAVNLVLQDLELSSGKVIFVLANPKAYQQNIREVEKNLNRCFYKENSDITYEDQRAKELMPILDSADALLDLHASNSREATPFIICEQPAYNLASKLDFNIISSGWYNTDIGSTDGYMYDNGKISLCLECGSVFEIEKNINLTKKSILQFLKYFDLIDSKIEYNSNSQRFILINRTGTKKTEKFNFSKDYADFEQLEENEIFATDGSEEYVAGENECIIFPRPNKKIGEKVFVIGNLNNKKQN